ncbi:MAG TPA: hypothetical protein DCM14_06120 [Clostridiales bacterium UBA8153]|nr:hypothetical protein [Clostridiales bacterium UBA8153]
MGAYRSGLALPHPADGHHRIEAARAGPQARVGEPLLDDVGPGFAGLHIDILYLNPDPLQRETRATRKSPGRAAVFEAMEKKG